MVFTIENCSKHIGPRAGTRTLENLRLFIDIDPKTFNLNPALLEDSPERKEANEYGWEIAYDTMEIKI